MKPHAHAGRQALETQLYAFLKAPAACFMDKHGVGVWASASRCCLRHSRPVSICKMACLMCAASVKLYIAFIRHWSPFSSDSIHDCDRLYVHDLQYAQVTAWGRLPVNSAVRWLPLCPLTSQIMHKPACMMARLKGALYWMHTAWLVMSSLQGRQ